MVVSSRVAKARVHEGRSGGEGQNEESTSAVTSMLGLDQNGDEDLTSVVSSLLRLGLEGVFRAVVSFLCFVIFEPTRAASCEFVVLVWDEIRSRKI